ncbi:MAG: ROK family protein [archaeon]
MKKRKEVIAVDLGGTNLRVARVRGKKIFDYSKYPTPKSKKGITDLLVSSISKIMTKDIRAIGVGSPGPLKDGIIKNPPNLPLKNFNIKKFLQTKFKKRVVVENDAGCVSLAEAKYGVRKKNFFILTLGTGVGGGIIIEGEIYRGEGYAGEVGHIIIGKGKDLEKHWQKYRVDSQRAFGRVLTIKELLKSRDKKAKKILERTSISLGQGIASLIDVLDPEVVVLMGGARESGRKFLKMIKKQTYKYSILPKKTPIKWSKIRHPGILGASLLVE